jgi:secreted trypsin-like serine protease
MFQGDDGGALVVNDNNGNSIVTGVVSFVSSRGCAVGDPMGFARITSFVDWIQKNTGPL